MQKPQCQEVPATLLILKISFAFSPPLKASEGDLDEFLASNNMQRVKVPADGNCFFVSLAIMIKQQLEKGILTAEGRTRLQQLGVIQSEKFETNHIASALRHVIVNEWLSNPSSYEPFLTSGQDYKKEANLFLQDGHFASELGNSMPLAAVNAPLQLHAALSVSF